MSVTTRGELITSALNAKQRKIYTRRKSHRTNLHIHHARKQTHTSMTTSHQFINIHIHTLPLNSSSPYPGYQNFIFSHFHIKNIHFLQLPVFHTIEPKTGT